MPVKEKERQRVEGQGTWDCHCEPILRIEIKCRPIHIMTHCPGVRRESGLEKEQGRPRRGVGVRMGIPAAVPPQLSPASAAESYPLFIKA